MQALIQAAAQSNRINGGSSPQKGKLMLSTLSKKLSKRFTNLSNVAGQPTAEELLAVEHMKMIKESVDQIKSLKSLASISKERLYKYMRVITLKLG